MYAVKVDYGRERAEARNISSGFLPTYRVKTDSPGKSVRWLVIPGYVFSQKKVRDAIRVQENEGEIIEKISDFGKSSYIGVKKMAEKAL